MHLLSKGAERVPQPFKHVRGSFQGRQLLELVKIDYLCMYYFEIVRDRVTGINMYNGPNVVLCSFYDVYVICHAKNRACKRVTANHKIHYTQLVLSALA